MNDYSNVTSMDWRTVAAVASAVCTVFSAIVGCATWYLKRLIRDSFTEFVTILDERFVSADTYAVEKTQATYDLKDINRRIAALETGPHHRGPRA